jgi:hypothetical protein
MTLGKLPFISVLAAVLVAASNLDAAENPIPGDEKVSKAAPTAPAIENLGGNRYRVGSIVVDKGRQTFSVPGTVLRDQPPFEFLAVTKNGIKGYESLLELDANAFEFNLACILIGLNEAAKNQAKFHFDPTPAVGDPVGIWVTWQVDGKSRRVAGAQLFRQSEQPAPSNDWVYTGSNFTDDNRYLAHLDGTLIGFVHEPATIIEHRDGIGLGNFGAVEVNKEHGLAAGMRVELVVERVAPSK